MRSTLLDRIAEVNKELWLLLSLLGIAAVINFAVTSHRVVLGFYALPTLFAAYFYGRRHALLTAIASVLLVTLLLQVNPQLTQQTRPNDYQKWLDLIIWGSSLLITAYAMGTLYEHESRHLAELREAYQGVLLILCHFVSKDSYTQNHSYRVSIYATRIADCLGLSSEMVEDVRAAALLHDIGKLDVSRQILYKAAKLTEDEYQQILRHIDNGARLVDAVGGPLRRVVPLILAHHDRFNGSGPHQMVGEEIPLGARIIAVADVYDALTSDRPYRKGSSPLEARDYLLKVAGEEFDPRVVDAFAEAFRRGLMEVPEVLV